MFMPLVETSINLTNVDSLPVELILKIFENLSCDDLKNASRTCKFWNHVVQHPAIFNKILLHFELVKLTSSTSPVIEFLNSTRKYKHVYLTEVTLGFEHDLFWSKFSEDITNLCLDSIFTDFEKLESILRKLTNLTHLELKYCKFAIDERSLEKQTQQKRSCYWLINLKSVEITVSKSKTIEPELISEILEKAPNVERFKCIGFRRGHNTPILNFIEKQTIKLKVLILDPNPEFLNKLFEFSFLNLEKLVLYDSLLNEKTTFCKFLASQGEMTRLTLIDCVIDDTVLKKICTLLPNLTHFDVSVADNVSLKNITNSGLSELRNLEKLKELDFQLYKIPATLKAIASKRNETLTDLHLNSLGKRINTVVIKRLSNLPNLTCLQLEFCANISDFEFQLILMYSTKLVEFFLMPEKGILTDFGLTGVKNKKSYGHSISSLISLQRLYIGRQNKFTDLSLQHLGRCRNLEVLGLCSKKITQNGIREIKRNVISLKCISVKLKNCMEIDVLRHFHRFKKLVNSIE